MSMEIGLHSTYNLHERAVLASRDLCIKFIRIAYR